MMSCLMREKSADFEKGRSPPFRQMLKSPVDADRKADIQSSRRCNFNKHFRAAVPSKSAELAGL